MRRVVVRNNSLLNESRLNFGYGYQAEIHDFQYFVVSRWRVDGSVVEFGFADLFAESADRPD